jgi:hypothetical protein
MNSRDTQGRIAAVILNCEPAGGTHPKRDHACAVLEGVNGDFAKIKPRHQACTLIYAPVDVSVAGRWHNTPVLFQTTFPNRCSADRDSDGVFAF